MIPYLSVTLIGALVGYSELVSRYKDQPSAILRAPGAWVYMAINGVAAVAALRLANLLGWDMGQPLGELRSTLLVLVTGFGAMAVARTSLLNVSINGQDTPLGLVTVLNSFLAAADRSVDRARSEKRFADAQRIMKDVSFDHAHTILPAAILAAMQNATGAEAEDLRKSVAAINATTQPESDKGIQLGLILMTLVGSKALEAAVKTMSHDARVIASLAPPSATNTPASSEGI